MTRSDILPAICCSSRSAERLKSCVRETDLVARLGGDEFAILQTNLDDVANAGVLASKIYDACVGSLSAWRHGNAHHREHRDFALHVRDRGTR